MFFRHHVDKLIYPVIVLVIVVLICYRPTYHLRAEMPDAFFSQGGNGQASSREQKIAWAYWESAQMDVQWKYTRGRPLPPEPAREFHVNAEALGPAASDPGTRQLYWHRLQEVWFEPDTWTSDYEWDWGWASDPLASAGSWLRRQADRFFTIR